MNILRVIIFLLINILKRRGSWKSR